jgi:release factor glutamine methyltransferase
MMDIQAAWAYGRSQLTPTSPTPHLDARLLLQHVLEQDHSYLIAHGEVELTAVQHTHYLSLLNRAIQHEPIPYLIGRVEFYGREFVVNSAVLIPRPETEQLVEKAIHWAKSHSSVHVVDVGTGSGCIAISLALQLPQAQVAAVDNSAEALAIAQQNGARLAPGLVQFHQGQLLQPITTPIDLLVANLPYVTDGEWTMLDDAVKLHEPSTALKGGVDGFDLIRECLHQATTKLNPGAAIFLEIGWQQGALAREIAQSIFPTAVIEVYPDYAGHDRVVVIQTG